MMSKFNWEKFHKDLDTALAIWLTEVERSSIHDELLKFLEYSNQKRLKAAPKGKAGLVCGKITKQQVVTKLQKNRNRMIDKSTVHPTDNALDEALELFEGSGGDYELTKQRLIEWSDKRLIAELEKAHRAGGTADFDNSTDEYIDERIEELKGQV